MLKTGFSFQGSTDDRKKSLSPCTLAFEKCFVMVSPRVWDTTIVRTISSSRTSTSNRSWKMWQKKQVSISLWHVLPHHNPHNSYLMWKGHLSNAHLQSKWYYMSSQRHTRNFANASYTYTEVKFQHWADNWLILKSKGLVEKLGWDHFQETKHLMNQQLSPVNQFELQN